jgi:HEAT repeat protein
MLCLLGAGVPTLAQPDPASPGAPEVNIPGDASIESLFVDFLHYARLGRFTVADAYARALLERPDLDAVRVLEVANKDRESLATLLILIKNSSIGENAARVLALIQEGERVRRQSSDRIEANIRMLAGDPQQEHIAQRRLAESGEYAIPQMIAVLLDSSSGDLWPRVITALPNMGKSAVSPLVMALRVQNNDVRLNVIRALGEIGYPQAIPYLRMLAEDSGMSQQVRDAADHAVQRIEAITGRTYPGTAAALFFWLGERFYSEDDAVRADPRLDEANVWYWDEDTQTLRRTVVPRRLHAQIMAMRCCQEALRLQPDHEKTIALWLAANIRREHRLGLNVESGDPAEQGEPDPTRPDGFPRALYFTQAAGPRYAHRVLGRAVRDDDSVVALAAIEALRVTAGEASMIGTEDIKQPLVDALQFPDLVIRTRAALALGAALPKSQFTGSEWVVPVLANAVGLTGREQLVLVDPDEARLNRIAGMLRDGDRDVVSDTTFLRGLERARGALQAPTAFFIAADVREPDLVESLRRLRDEFVYRKTPVVVLTSPQHDALAEELTHFDPYVEPVPASADSDAIEAALARVCARTGHIEIDADLASSLALAATETLRRIVVDGRTVFDVGVAEPALIGALASTDENLQKLAASALALRPTTTAQRAIAHVAMDDGNTESLRLAAFASLAESARNHGHFLEPAQTTALIDIAHDQPDLVLKTAASQALGALNLETGEASKIIRSYYGG